MKRALIPILLSLAWRCLTPSATWALDPPHDASRSINCASCHLTHHAAGGAITAIAGNPNLCLSCHTAGGQASSMSFADTDEAIPATSGTSHRWDSGASGWVKANPANTSPGTLQSAGSFTGRYAKTYTITIKTAGDAGTARFDWVTSKPLSQTYRDEFTAIAYTGTNGTQNWSASPWQEIVEADGVSAGVVQVVANAACVSGNCLRIGGGTIDTRGVRRPANVSGGSSAMVTFSYQRRLATCPNTSTANVALQVSSDGTTWTTLATYNLNACDTIPIAQAFDITQYIAATAQLRFLAAGTAGASDFIYVDNVQLEYFVSGGGATSVTTGAGVALDEGITVSFVNGTSSPAFKLNDQWTVYASRDVNQPTTPALAARMADGKVTCSTCHNEHSQAAEPFDAAAPPYPASGPGGNGRHDQRVDDNTNQMCSDCHSARNVTSSAQGSHPVRVAIPGGNYKSPSALPLDKTTRVMQCMTCHKLHYTGPVADGSLLRLANVTSLCTDCHTLADTTSPAVHLSPASGVLWPGPQYGTLFPRITDATKRGSCINCHQSHGWPDGANPGQDYPTLLVNREENLCNACHDGSPAAKNVLRDFTKSYRHPTTDYSGRHSVTEGGTPANFGTANRHAECEDCHNSHVAKADASAPAAPNASNRIRGVSRIAVTNGAAGTVPAYAYRAPNDSTAPIAEYQMCFKCHSSWTTQPAGQSDTAVQFNANNPSYHPVEAAGKNTNINANAFVNGWTGPGLMYCTDCHTSEDATIRAPHGSQYRYLLKQPYTASSSRRTTASTEVCFNCHSFNTYANTGATTTQQNYSRFGIPAGGDDEGHAKHVVEHQAPCYACHGSHASATKPHLIVTGRSPGINTYTETATGGTCSPTCHDSQSYRVTYAR